MKPHKILQPIPVAEYKRQITKSKQEEQTPKKDISGSSKLAHNKKAKITPTGLGAGKRKYTGENFNEPEEMELPEFLKEDKVNKDQNSKNKKMTTASNQPRENKENDPVKNDPNEKRSQDDSGALKNDPSVKKDLGS